MPILVALVEAMVDPQYGLEHSGNTPGSETVAAWLALHAETGTEQGPSEAHC